MDRATTERLILNQFQYTPTSGQRILISKLSDFLINYDSSDLLMIRGYAGTGKTTIVSSLVKIVPLLGMNAVLLAPTGRAAKVLAGYSGKPAYTIHKKIYRTRALSDGSLALDLQSNLHRNTIFIIDEASMIQNDCTAGDLSLFSSRLLLDDLITFIKQGNRNKIILIGDMAQLPPVGLKMSPALQPGYLTQHYALNIDFIELSEVVRQSEQSGVLETATAIRHKIIQKEITLPFFDIGGLKDVSRISGYDLQEILSDSFSECGQEGTVVICRTNKRANIFNQEIRRRILYQEEEIAAGDYMMVVRNNYFWLPQDSPAGFIANGDIIQLLRIRMVTEMFGFRFADVVVRMVDYPEINEIDVRIMLDTITSGSAALTREDDNRLFKAIMDDYGDIPGRRRRLEKVKNNPFFNALQVKFAYALTCHKTQGGQWRNVFVDQGYLTDEMIDLEYLRWLYTAITRATVKLYLVNFQDKFFV